MAARTATSSVLPSFSDPLLAKPSVTTQQLAEVAESATFHPSRAQREIKARFWQRAAHLDALALQNLSLSGIREITQSASVSGWWSSPQFQLWFLNRDSQRERLDALFDKMIDAAEAMVDNDETPAAAKVQLFKVVAELAGKLPKSAPVQAQSGDAEISAMDAGQVEAYLAQRGVSVRKETVLELQAEALKNPN